MEKTDKYPNVSFRLTGALHEQVQQRVDDGETLSFAAKRELERHCQILALDLARVDLTPDEAMLLLDALNGATWEGWSATLLWANGEDSLPGLADKWGVDGRALVQKLRALTPGQSLAVVDAAERWWRRPQAEGESREDSLRRVGLLPQDSGLRP